MKDLTQAVKVAVFVRNYIRENAAISKTKSAEILRNNQRIADQVKNLKGLK